jgi:hypothetical protein
LRINSQTFSEPLNGGAETYGDFVNPDPDLDDPFYEDGPSGETLLEAIKDLSPSEIAEMVNRGGARVLTRPKPRLEFETPLMLSIDITYMAFYGDREELVRGQRSLRRWNASSRPCGVPRTPVG